MEIGWGGEKGFAKGVVMSMRHTACFRLCIVMLVGSLWGPVGISVVRGLESGTGFTRSPLPPSPDRLLRDLPPRLAAWLRGYLDGRMRGEASSPARLAHLRHLLKVESVSTEDHCAMLALLHFIDGGEAARELFGHAVDRVVAALQERKPGDARDDGLLTAAWRLRPILWELGEWRMSERVLRQLSRWEARGSRYSQWVNQMRAESVYLQERYSEAYDLYVECERERVTASEPSVWINRPLEWELGVCRYLAGRHAEAVPHLRNTTRIHGVPEARKAWPLLIVSLARTGNRGAAEALMDQWIVLFKPSVDEVHRTMMRMDYKPLAAR